MDASVGSAGFTFKYYNLTSANIEDNIADIRGAKSTVTLDRTETKYDVDISNYHRNRLMVHFRGYFRANITGKHVFKMNSYPEVATVYLSNVANSTDDSNL